MTSSLTVTTSPDAKHSAPNSIAAVSGQHAQPTTIYFQPVPAGTSLSPASDGRIIIGGDQQTLIVGLGVAVSDMTNEMPFAGG